MVCSSYDSRHLPLKQQLLPSGTDAGLRKDISGFPSVIVCLCFSIFPVHFRTCFSLHKSWLWTLKFGWIPFRKITGQKTSKQSPASPVRLRQWSFLVSTTNNKPKTRSCLGNNVDDQWHLRLLLCARKHKKIQGEWIQFLNCFLKRKNVNDDIFTKSSKNEFDERIICSWNLYFEFYKTTRGMLRIILEVFWKT